MMVPPLSERPVTEEDEEQFRRESMPRTYTLRQRWADYRADARANRPKGVKARVRAWLHVEPFYWGMRAAYVVLVVGAVFAGYINGVANGWWHAWGEKPTVAATTPAARPAPSASSSTEAAMSGGYQIGPDGILVRPAEHATSTYTKPELPEEAKENTERGAALAADYLLDTLSYAWNTGDTELFEEMSASDSQFAREVTQRIRSLYDEGWLYNDSSIVEHVLKLEPAEASDGDGADNAVAVVLAINSTDGTICQKKNIYVHEQQYHSIFALVLTWDDGHWVVTRAGMEKTDD